MKNFDPLLRTVFPSYKIDGQKNTPKCKQKGVKNQAEVMRRIRLLGATPGGTQASGFQDRSYNSVDLC